MRGGRRGAVLLLAVAAWTGFIFCRSLKTGEASHAESAAVLAMLDMLSHSGLTEHMVRKAGHFLEFAVLGALAARLSGRLAGGRLAGWALAVLGCMAVAVCDETLQLFVEGRGSSLVDVWIDTGGAASGALAAAVIGMACSACRKRA